MTLQSQINQSKGKTYLFYMGFPSKAKNMLEGRRILKEETGSINGETWIKILFE